MGILSRYIRIGFLALLFLFATTTFSQTAWKVSKSAITFKIKNAGITVDGSFGGLVADIKFDSVNFFKSSIDASVDVNTIDTDNKLRNKHLKKEEYFDTAHYRTISMKATMFSKEGNGQYKGFFKLTMKGVTKDIVVPFSFIESSDNAAFKATFKLNRRDYNVGSSSLILSDDVTLDIEVVCTKG